MSGTTVTAVSDESHFETLTSSLPTTSLLVLYFHAPWAAPCAQMSTVLDALASTYKPSDPPKITFISINAEELPELSETYDVTAVPYIVLQRSGNTLETISGSDAAKVRSSVEKHYGGDGSKANGTQQLPPAQQVTRPAQQPLPPASTMSNADAADPAQAKSSNPNATSSATKNLSSYAPDAKDPDTAPAYSSTTEPQLGTKTANGSNGTDLADLNTRLQQLTTAAPVMLFMKGTPSAPQCGFSRQLVSILRENSVRYGFFNILADEEVRQGLKEYADWPTFPQLWMSGELVGGLDIVKEEMEQNSGFFEQYSVDTTKRNEGGPAAPAMQKEPTAA